MSKEDVEELVQNAVKLGVVKDEKFNLDWLRMAISKLTPLVAQKEQKGAANDEFFDLLNKGETPTPTVKEESHTQGWEEDFDARFELERQGCSECGGAELLDKKQVVYDLSTLKAFTKEIASQEYQRGALYNHEGTFTRGFEAGRLQGIADAVAVIENIAPKTLTGNRVHGKCPECKNPDVVCKDGDILIKDTWIYEQIITALSSLTHKS